MTTTKKWAAGLFISGYVSFLSWGIVAHALNVGAQGNTISYFAIWDMFCGWHAYENRTHILAESHAGEFYEVKPPWGELQPFGRVPRINHDVTNQLIPKYINHVLKRTSHDTIDRVYVVEELWAKQYNLPEPLWQQYYDRPRDPISYYHLRAVFNDTGVAVNQFPDWYTQQTLNSIADNPRLQREMTRARSSYSTLFTPAGALQTTEGLNSYSPQALSTN